MSGRAPDSRAAAAVVGSSAQDGLSVRGGLSVADGSSVQGGSPGSPVLADGASFRSDPVDPAMAGKDPSVAGIVSPEALIGSSGTQAGSSAITPVLDAQAQAGRRRRASPGKIVTVRRREAYVPRPTAELERECLLALDQATDLDTLDGRVLGIRQIRLVKTWDARVDRDTVRGWRVVGICIYVLEDVFREGVLARNVERTRYRMVLNDTVIELVREPVDEWLLTVRGGHHGGPGRCQGVKAPDCTYPRPVAMKLPEALVAFFAGKGGGQISLGLRVAAREAVAARLTVPQVRSTRGGTSLLRVKAYLDETSIQTYLALGDGNLSLGVKRLYLGVSNLGSGFPAATAVAPETNAAHEYDA